jgi:hypothetical protein
MAKVFNSLFKSKHKVPLPQGITDSHPEKVKLVPLNEIVILFKSINSLFVNPPLFLFSLSSGL